MKYCDDHAALLDLYVDGELSPQEMAAVQAHLNECPGCRAYVDDALALRAAFPTVDETEVPDGFAESVMAAIQAQTTPGAPKAGTKKSPWPRLLASLAACCAIVLLIRGVGLGNGSKGEPAADMAAPMVSEAYMEVPSEPAAQEEGDTQSTLTASAPADLLPMCEAAKNMTEDITRTASSYFVVLTLPADALEMEQLADCPPVSQADGETQYELSADAYAALLDELDASGIRSLAQEQTGNESETALVVVMAP